MATPDQTQKDDFHEPAMPAGPEPDDSYFLADYAEEVERGEARRGVHFFTTNKNLYDWAIYRYLFPKGKQP